MSPMAISCIESTPGNTDAMVTLITLVLNPVRPDSLVGRASGIYPVGPGFNPQCGHLFVLTQKR